MAFQFQVEDGTAYSNSTSYASEQFFAQYCTNMGNTAATWDSTRIQKNLNIATAYLDARYGQRYKGRKYSKNQTLLWPRIGVVLYGTGADSFVPGFGPTTDGFILNPNEIPIALQQAVCEMAIRCDTKVPAPDILPGSDAITRKKVGPLEIEFDRNQPYLPYTIWRYVDMLLTPILRSTSMSATIVRS